MQQVIQNIRNGKLSVVELPDPMVRPGQVLIANAASVISAGTEKMAMDLARKSLLGKARERPDQVRRVIEKLRNEGVLQTFNQVRARLEEPMTMGYSSAGIVLACGAGVQAYKPGDRVASNGPHAGIVSVPVNLTARVPDGVPLDQAAFAVLGAIALQGVRLAEVQLGETAFVVGLGLIGQITVALLAAAGVRVIGTDLDPSKCELALKMGASVARKGLDSGEVTELTRGLGADAVLLTAATDSNGPIELAAEAVRKKGKVVLVGVVGLELPRRPFFFKEAEFVVSCSYGPGRYDPDYEDRGRDYPAGYVRWTEQRNIQAVLDLMGQGRLDVSLLVSHRFPIVEAEKAYALIDGGKEPYLGILLEYPEVEGVPRRRIELRSKRHDGHLGVGCIGAGSFARTVLLPAIRRAKELRPRLLCSAGGLHARKAGEEFGFDAVTSDEAEVIADPKVQTVFIITRHDQHARQTLAAIEARKHVFVEKPLALTVEELVDIDRALAKAGNEAPLVMVGFNRRFSEAATTVRRFFETMRAPLTASVRFNAGEIPLEHWVQDDEEGGGRIIGEACHAIDLVTYLTGSPPVRVFAESIGGPNAPAITDDQCFITLRHENGSVSSVAYLAGGDRALPKERVEVFGGGRAAFIEDFRTITMAARGQVRTEKTSGKGHDEEVAAFARALAQGGAPPISWDELYRVSLAAILAVRSLREGIPFDVPGPGVSLGDMMGGA